MIPEIISENREVVVRQSHCRALRICSKGQRRFAKDKGLDYDRFLSEGLPAGTLADTGNAFAIRAAKKAIEEAHGG